VFLIFSLCFLVFQQSNLKKRRVMSEENLQEKLIGFAKLDKAVIVNQTVVQFSPKVFDFLSRHTDHTTSGGWKGWQSTKVQFDLLINSRDKTRFSDGKTNGRPRLYLANPGAMGKRVVIEDVLNDGELKTFTAQHRADLEVALKELADAVRAEKQTLDADLQAF
jgi:mRNA-degrading endonuclease YafQ of YafQ-DinJ toxin-antitoxin module